MLSYGSIFRAQRTTTGEGNGLDPQTAGTLGQLESMNQT